MSLKHRLTYTQLIALGFLAIVLIGALLLSLPVATRSGEATPFIDALFTSTSATCVTGLIQFDTATYWSLFGQIVILLLIQIGGLGFMTVLTLFSLFLRRRIGLHERKLIMASAGTMRLDGIILLIKRVAIGTFMFEGLGAILLATRFIPDMGIARGAFSAVFTSISAFCNAGFDMMGVYGKFSSLTSCADDPVVNITVMALIVIGGLGFLVWSELINNRFKLKKLSLHSKIVLFVTVLLIIIPAVLFFVTENNASMKGMTLPQRIMASFFASVSPRTAGFNTVDLTALSEAGGIITMVLMFIGGSPGSTAGGIKTTTFVVLLMSLRASAVRQPDITIFKRRLDNEIVHKASAIACIYMIAVILGAILLCILYPFSMKESLFEVISASGTVGLTLGITTQLGVVGKILIMILMFGGRVGGLSLALVLAEKRESAPVKRPSEKILVG